MPSPPPLPRRTSYSQSDSATSRSPAGETTTSPTNRNLVVGLIVGLIALVIILVLLIATVGVGFGLGLIPLSGRGSTHEESGTESKSSTTGNTDDTKDSPKPQTDSKEQTSAESNHSSAGKPTPPPSKPAPTEKKDQDSQESNKPLPKDANAPSAPNGPSLPAAKNDASERNGQGTGAGSGANGSGKADKDNEFSIAGGSFFGLKAEKGSIVYVVDCSGSMVGPPFERARKEILRSVKALAKNQAYFVVLFSDSSFPMYFPDEHPKMVLATPDNFKKLEHWLSDFSHPGGTAPTDALLMALRLRPKTIFFLTDGEFDPGVVDSIRIANTKKIPINTISFVTRSGEPLLKMIAAQNKGVYTFVP